MKILRIIARLNVGGPARHVIWLTRAFNNDQFQTTLLAGTVPDGEDDMSFAAAEQQVEPVYIPELSRELSANDITALFKIYRYMRRFEPDIVHTHTAKAGTVGRLAALMYRWLTWRSLNGKPRKLKIVHTFHGHVFHGYYSAPKTKVFLFIERFLARFATDRIIAISGQQLDEINGQFRVGRAEKFAVVPLGIDLERFASADKQQYILRNEIGADGRDIVVGYVGRLTEIKDLPHFIDVAGAINDMAGDGPRFKFVLIGDGSLRAELETQAARTGNNIRFLGNRRDVDQLIPGLDIVALTSRNEGTPLSLIEAMAAGVPFVSTAVGGVIDLAGELVNSRDGFQIHERGVLVPCGDRAAFRDALIYLANNEQLRKALSERGREFAAEHYSTTRLERDLRKLYSALTADNIDPVVKQ